MENKITVNGNNGNNKISVSGSQENQNINVDTNRVSISINAINNNALFYSDKAKEYAEQSKESAEKSEESAKQSQNALSEIKANEDLKKVSANEENINKVATDIQNVNFVGENIEDITELVTSLENLGDTTNINIVASNIDNINSLAENIQTVEENKNIVLSQVAVAVEQANISTENANISTEKALESKTFSENALIYSTNAKTSETNARDYSETALQQSTIATTQANISITQANNSLNYSKNAKTSEENALIYSNNAKLNADTALENANISEINSINAEIWAEGTDEEVQALGGVHSAKVWAEISSSGSDIDTSNFVTTKEFYSVANEFNEILEYTQDTKQDKLTAGENITIENNVISATGGSGGGMPIGSIYSLNCTENYVPEGSLLCNGAEYTKGQFTDLWNNYLTGEEEKEIVINSEWVIDEPCIVENGVVSNPSDEIFEIDISEIKRKTYFEFNASDDVTTAQQVLMYGTIGVYIKDGQLYCAYSSVSAVIGTPLTISPNSTFYVNYSVIAGTSSRYSLKVDNSDWVTIEEQMFSKPTEIVLGGSKGFKGSVNLANSYMGSDDEITPFTSEKITTKTLLKTCTYEEYQQEIATYGQCAKFAVDMENEKFRVPFIKDGAVVQQALSDSELGKSYNAGLPNITGAFPTEGTKWLEGAFYNAGVTAKTGATGSDGNHDQTLFDASLCSTVYGNSDTVQMNAVALRFFVFVANGSINQSQMNWSEWASSLNGKANADLSNCTKPYIKETFVDGASGYIVYSNGYCEQWGNVASGSNSDTVTLLKPYRDTNYNVQITYSKTSSVDNYSPISNITTTDTFIIYSPAAGAKGCNKAWQAKGFIS